MDLIDYSNIAYNNNTYILTVIDYYLQYAQALPLKNKSLFSVSNRLSLIIKENHILYQIMVRNL